MSDDKTTKIEPEVKTPENGAGAPDNMAGAGPAADAPAGPSVEDLVPGLEELVADEDRIQARIDAAVAEITAERDALKDKMMRALAEAENVRRRAERDQRDAQTYGGTRLARDLLAVYDNLSRAVDAADEQLRSDHGQFLEGVELTKRELVNAFSKHKISAVTPEKGEKFDPNEHQAMFEAPVPGAENGTIVDVMQAGFKIADRLLRPALVGVAKAVPGAARPEAAKAEAEPEAGEAAAQTGDKAEPDAS
ncbi:MAG: nucleotide exchange factor GrpE [Pseudomonadota bacterium]